MAVRRFIPRFDVMLLRERVGLRPKNSDEWEKVVQNLNHAINGDCADDGADSQIKFTVRACKDRIKLLLDAHKKEELEQLRA